MNSLFSVAKATLFFGAVIIGPCLCFAQSGDFNQSAKRVADNKTKMPYVMDMEHSAISRQMNKPVLETRLLDDMEQETHWSHHGYGKVEFTQQRAIDGTQSISLISPTLTSKPTSGRPMGTAVLRRSFQQEDWSEYNRLSFWIYPIQPEAQVISMGVVLYVAQDDAVEFPYNLEIPHYFHLKPHQWNHIIWEIPHVVRHKVEAVEFHYRIRGRQAGLALSTCFDIDRLELQRVEPDYFEGWAVAPGRIATSHTGYEPDAKKTAISSTISGDTFQLVHAEKGEVVLTEKVKKIRVPLGDFQILDFSKVHEPGNYLIRAEDATSPPIRIQDNIWLETIWKTINFFYCERCGIEIPGIHDVCHRDLQTVHADKKIIANGGWHDAGDLSQGLTRTAEATHAMLRLAENISEHDPDLAARLTEEARWGLEWMLKTRFGDGYRTVWSTMDLWTDGILGNMDDIVWDAGNDPQANLIAATAEAAVFSFFQFQEPQLAAQALQAAEEDWRFATKEIHSIDLQTAAFAANAAVELFEATGKTSYASAAIEHGKTIINCQQKSYTAWRLPVAGFFYTTPDKQHIVHYDHMSYEQAPIVALSQLCETFPDHPDWIEWYSTIVLYSEYLKTVSSINEPYFMTPASIYNIDELQNANYFDQIKNGVPLSETHFLRRFPVWGGLTYRGNNSVLLSQVKALSTAGRLRRDPGLLDLAQNGIEWIVGKNPFSQSLMASEGYDSQPLYSQTSGDIVGALPVGIMTNFDSDVPYWPSDNQSCYKEVWVHPATRWLSIMNDVTGISKSSNPVINDQQENHFNFSLSQETKEDGSVSITLTVEATELDSFDYSIRASNLQSHNLNGRMDIHPNHPTTMVWSAQMISIDEPWIAVFIPNQDISHRQEIVGSPQAREVNGRSQLFAWSSEAAISAETDRQLTNFPEPKKLGDVVSRIKNSTPADSLELVLIQAGHFLMGSPSTERGAFHDAEAISTVTISQSFFLGKHEVTQAEWENVMGNNPAQYSGKPDNPIESVTWEQCAQFCNKLSRLNGYEPAYNETNWKRKPKADGFRLPTEAEWEYACRAGTTTRFSFGNALESADAGDSFSETLDTYLWWRGNNGGAAYSGSGTKPVGVKMVNPWGLYGMHGNVSEWCEDYWVTKRTPGPTVDPRGPNNGTTHVIRGGYFGSYLRYCRSASRYCDAGDHYGDYDFVGFRILLPATDERIKNFPAPVTK
jgi:formylglycine-generating enzyme required for sulfatase activity